MTCLIDKIPCPITCRSARRHRVHVSARVRAATLAGAIELTNVGVDADAYAAAADSPEGEGDDSVDSELGELGGGEVLPPVKNLDWIVVLRGEVSLAALADMAPGFSFDEAGAGVVAYLHKVGRCRLTSA